MAIGDLGWSFGMGLEAERSRVSLIEKDSISRFTSIPEYEGLSHVFPILWMAEARETSSVKSHLRRIQNGSYWLALKAGESRTSAKNIALASIFHDIGMGWMQPSVEVSHWYAGDSSCRDRQEPHTWLGADFLRDLPQSIGKLAADIALNHHERWDGMGSPGVFSVESIPIAARIVGLVHFFEENTHSDPRGMRMKHNCCDVIEMIAVAGGRYFDPRLSGLVASNAEEFVAVMQPSENMLWAESEKPEILALVSGNDYLVDVSKLLGVE